MNQEIINIIENKGVKATPMRMLVLELLITKKESLSLTEIEKLLFKSDRTTIYRTLKTFVENGLAHDIDAGNNLTKYALCKEHCDYQNHLDYHPHFVCIKCKKTICERFSEFITPQVPSNIEGFLIQKIETIVKGICKECQ